MTHTIGNGGNTAFTDRNSNGVTATISNISLTKDSNWWDVNWNYKRYIKLNNLSSTNIPSSPVVQININTKKLEFVKTNCEDLRIVYQNSTDIPRSYSLSSGTASCNTSNSTTVTFQLKSQLNASSSNSKNYSLSK